MYLYQPCLLTLSLYAWAFYRPERKSKWFRILLPLAVLALSEWELSFTRISLYPASMLLAAGFLFRRLRSVAWPEMLTASFLCGLLCWKAADTWPLFRGIIPGCAVISLIFPVLFCKSRDDRLFACTLGSLSFELFFCLKEYILFSFCVVRLGSRDALSLAAAALCLYGLAEQIRLFAISRKKHTVSLSN